MDPDWFIVANLYLSRLSAEKIYFKFKGNFGWSSFKGSLKKSPAVRNRSEFCPKLTLWLVRAGAGASCCLKWGWKMPFNLTRLCCVQARRGGKDQGGQEKVEWVSGGGKSIMLCSTILFQPKVSTYYIDSRSSIHSWEDSDCAVIWWWDTYYMHTYILT